MDQTLQLSDDQVDGTSLWEACRCRYGVKELSLGKPEKLESLVARKKGLGR